MRGSRGEGETIVGICGECQPNHDHRGFSHFPATAAYSRTKNETRRSPRMDRTSGDALDQGELVSATAGWRTDFAALRAGETTDRSITWSHRDIPELRKPELRPQRDTASAINRSHLNQSIHSTPLLFPSHIRREQEMVRTKSVCG